MSLYLYPEYHEGAQPFGNSSTTSRLLLRIISKWDTPDLWESDSREHMENATMYQGVFTAPDLQYRDDLYHRHAFVLAQANAPRTLETFIPWIKENWSPRDVLEFGIKVGSGDITRETYSDAMDLLDKIVAAETHIRAL